MANKNDSSQMRECLSHQDTAKDSRAGLSKEPMDTSALHQRHSEGECSGTEATDLRQKPHADLRQKPDAEAEPGDTCCGRKLKREPDCHMQLDKLRADKNHTVIIDVSALKLISNSQIHKLFIPIYSGQW